MTFNLALFYGCEDATEDKTKLDETTTSVATTAITTATEPIASLSERIAKLIREDGTGTISIGMHRSDVLKLLDEENIPYSMIAGDIELGDGLYFGLGGVIGGGTYYHFDFDTLQLDSIYPMMQSFRGLKVGDSVQRVLELYGEPDEYYDVEFEYFQYLFPTDEGTVSFTVGVRGLGDDAKVFEMNLYFRSAEEMAER